VSQEIERKFLVQESPVDVTDRQGSRLRQGYLAVDDAVEVRIRSDGKRATLTVKAGQGLTRTEVETALGQEQFDALWPLTEGRRIEKLRHRIPVGEQTAELDRYEGSLSGLCVVEVEFGSVDEAERFDPPEWFGEELTGIPGWSNADLAAKGRPDR